MRILTASDLHIASRWEHLLREMSTVWPDRADKEPSLGEIEQNFERGRLFTWDTFHDSYVNPNRNLGRIIAKANDLASREELDCVLFTGDLVDYKFKRPRARSGPAYQDSEWSLFEAIVLGQTEFGPRLQVPLFTALGNHDYRLYPYRIQTYGIRHSGIPDFVSECYLKETQGWRRIKHRLRDLDAVRVCRGNRHSLEFYYRSVSPFNYYAVDLGAVSLIVLDTGPDFYCERQNLSPGRLRRFLDSILDRAGGPRSSGPDDAQIAFLERQLGFYRQKPSLVVAHSPAVNPVTPDHSISLVPILVPDFEGKNRDSVDASVSFENQLARAGWNSGGMYRNILPFLSALRGAHQKVIALSGHAHWKIEVLLSKDTGELLVGDFADRSDAADLLRDHVFLLQTPAVGHIERQHLAIGTPANRIIEFDGAELVRAWTCQLDVSPFGSALEDWSVEQDGREERVRFRLTAKAEDVKLFRVVVFAVDIGQAQVFSEIKFRISMQDPTGFAPKIRLGDGLVFFIAQPESRPVLDILNRPHGFKLGFAFERISCDRNERSRSTSLRVHHRILE